MPIPLFKAMAAGLLKAAEFTDGSEDPALLERDLLELLQLSSFKYSQIVGLDLEAQLVKNIRGKRNLT